MWSRLTPYLLLAGLGLLFFVELVRHPTEVLYSDHSDLLAEHIPAKRFLVRSWQQTGELPLWCPHSFAGAPLLHDPQVAAFYPPHMLLLLLPERAVGPTLSWLIVIHVILAGWGTFAYARRQGLSSAAAIVAACGFMFAGKWMLHLLAAGHYITVGLAWLPLLLMALDAALRRRSPLHATWAGVVYALMVLGMQPQWTFYAGLFVALWTLGTALEQAGYLGGEGERSLRRTLSALAWWAGCGVWTALVAVALAAVQLLPTVEAAGLSTRASGLAADDALDGGLRSLLSFVGPALRLVPSCLQWEDRGGFGLLWVAAAAMAPLLCRGRVRFQAGVCLMLILFAFGASVLFQPLPGFRLFRQPARMLLVAVFPMALLAGTATDALFGNYDVSAEMCHRGRRVLARVTAAVGILVGGFALRTLLEGAALHFHVYWVSLLVTVPAAFWLLGNRPPLMRRQAVLGWGALLLLDLWALALPLVQVRAEEEVYATSACVAALPSNGLPGGRVLDRDAPGLEAGTPLGAGAPLAFLHGLEPLRGYNPLDNRRYKEYLMFVAGDDRELPPLATTLTFPVIGNFPIANKPLLDLLGTRWLLQPSAMPVEGDGWRRVAEDASPTGYDFITGGRQALPPYTLYENSDALPRAFVVAEAWPLPQRSQVLQALTTTDFRRRVLLEGWDGGPQSADAAWSEARVAIREYLPNRVVLDVEVAAPGFLVLTDLWYPGWRCAIDGVAVPLYRANYLFRATPVTAGRHEVAFIFAPDSYRTGRTITMTAMVLLAVLAVAAVVRRRAT